MIAAYLGVPLLIPAAVVAAQLCVFFLQRDTLDGGSKQTQRACDS